MEYRKLDKKAMTCMYVKSGIYNFISIISLMIIYFTIKGETSGMVKQVVSIIILCLVAIIVVDIIVVPKIRYERYRYLLNEEEFAVRKGLFIIKTEIVPIERLHKIEVSSGPIFRAFGLKEIKVTTAGGEIRVSYLSNDVADKIAEHLKARINTIVVEKRNVRMDDEEDVHGTE